jgi:methyl-accepting chemotaxis protein
MPLVKKGDKMKKLLLAVLLSLSVISSYAFAGMGGSGGGMMGNSSGGMMGGQQMGSGMTGSQQGHMGQMMTHGDMMGNMNLNMRHMTDIMQRMSDVLHKDMSASDLKEMSVIMREISLHMTGMADIMNRGSASQEEMQKVNDHMTEIEKRFNMMKFR